MRAGRWHPCPLLSFLYSTNPRAYPKCRDGLRLLSLLLSPLSPVLFFIFIFLHRSFRFSFFFFFFIPFPDVVNSRYSSFQSRGRGFGHYRTFMTTKRSFLCFSPIAATVRAVFRAICSATVFYHLRFDAHSVLYYIQLLMTENFRPDLLR